ncbi:MAG: hypothetical protein ACRD3D_16100 [Terriglobia bacterium]
MAFIRKRGGAYYLVHNVRNKGRVEQLHLARLGKRPRIDDEVIHGVAARHPFLRVDWDGLRERTSRELATAPENYSEYMRNLIDEVRGFHVNLADVHLPYLPEGGNRELRSQLMSELKLLRSTLDVKLNSVRKANLLNLRGRN